MKPTQSKTKTRTKAGQMASLRCDALVSAPCRACEIFGDGPCSPKAFEHMQNKVARAIHAEHNRHEGHDTPWIGLHHFQRDKYRGKAYAALVALGIPAPSSANIEIRHEPPSAE